MNDLIFVSGAYLAALGAVSAYAAMLVRRLRAARSARAAIDARRTAGTETRTQPQGL
ncbi:MAG: hypothetical protein HY262_01525 [Chloroflexi bacterium]|nr:hypothetical protein [Chloroflexota bacterium]